MPKFRVFYEMTGFAEIDDFLKEVVYHKDTDTGLSGFKIIEAIDEYAARDQFMYEAHSTRMWDDLKPIYLPVNFFEPPVIIRVESVD